MAEDCETVVLHAEIPEEAVLEGSHGQQRVTNAGSVESPGAARERLVFG